MSKNTKADAIDGWRKLPADMPMLEHMEAIPYKSEGSTYGACGIRIDGNPEFVDAVLSHLKELIGGENCQTRLGLSRRPVETRLKIRDTEKVFANTAERAEVCYIRLHERGREGKIMAAVFGTY